MSLALRNVRGTFQRAVDVLFAPVKQPTALVYLDVNK